MEKSFKTTKAQLDAVEWSSVSAEGRRLVMIMDATEHVPHSEFVVISGDGVDGPAFTLRGPIQVEGDEYDSLDEAVAAAKASWLIMEHNNRAAAKEAERLAKEAEKARKPHMEALAKYAADWAKDHREE